LLIEFAAVDLRKQVVILGRRRLRRGERRDGEEREDSGDMNGVALYKAEIADWRTNIGVRVDGK
jgi:hypothetical protein